MDLYVERLLKCTSNVSKKYCSKNSLYIEKHLCLSKNQITTKTET